MTNALIVGIGGFLGAMSRYLICEYFSKSIEKAWLPYWTLSVNLIGCLLLGLFAGYLESKNIANANIRLFAMIGFLGSFTTYSTFSFETFKMAGAGQIAAAVTFVILHIVLGLLASWGGFALTSS